jgi:hypothetical protein
MSGRPTSLRMSCEDAKRVRHCQRPPTRRASVMTSVSDIPRASEIDVLISLNYLPEGAEPIVAVSGKL